MSSNKLKMVIDKRLSAIHGTPKSKELILKKIKGEIVMKRKLRLVPILVALIILVLTTIALAMGTNLFGLFTNHYANEGYNTSLSEAAENAVLSTEDSIYSDIAGWIDIDSTFFDGQRLMVAYKLEGNANIIETWQPSPEELGMMNEVPNGMLPMFEQRNDSVNTFYNSYNAGTPYGLHLVATNRLDHTFTEDGVDMMYTDSGTINEDGIIHNYIAFENLPEVVQNRDVVNGELRFIQVESWYWFDGVKLYERANSSVDAEISVVFTAQKNR